MVSKPTKGGYPTATAVSYVTSGTYQRDLISASGQAFTDGTEFEISDISDVIIASTANKDELFSWVRGQFWMYITDTYNIYEWMLIRMKTADALPDLNDNAAVEVLQKDKRIYARGLKAVAGPIYGIGSPVKFELYNVALPYGEEIRLVIRPFVTTGANGVYRGLLEWRQVGV